MSTKLHFRQATAIFSAEANGFVWGLVRRRDSFAVFLELEASLVEHKANVVALCGTFVRRCSERRRWLGLAHVFRS